MVKSFYFVALSVSFLLLFSCSKFGGCYPQCLHCYRGSHYVSHCPSWKWEVGSYVSLWLPVWPWGLHALRCCVSWHWWWKFPFILPHLFDYLGWGIFSIGLVPSFCVWLPCRFLPPQIKIRLWCWSEMLRQLMFQMYWIFKVKLLPHNRYIIPFMLASSLKIQFTLWHLFCLLYLYLVTEESCA